MKNIVTINEHQLLVSLKDIISLSGNKYESVRDRISKNKEKFIELGLSIAEDMTDFKSAVFEDNLKLNEEQTAFLFILMDNTPQIVEFKFNLVKQFYILKDAVCEINKKQLQQKDKTITQLKKDRKAYGRKRGHGLETVTFIINDTESQISKEAFNVLLCEEGLITKDSCECCGRFEYKANDEYSIAHNNTILIHYDSAVNVLNKYNITRVTSNQQQFDFGGN
ncbi:MAG: hypothetical protein J7L21_00110 [Sulfurimonas sp.]|nr:hypothetical protein [Sulfurimonas sp.]